MIFQRALRRELASAAGATFTVLFSILLTWTLIGILGKAAGGKIASSDVLALIGFSALMQLPTILILTGFISVLMVVTRSYKESEMVVCLGSEPVALDRAGTQLWPAAGYPDWFSEPVRHPVGAAKKR